MGTEVLESLELLRNELSNDSLIYSTAQRDFGIHDADSYEVSELIDACLAVEYRLHWV